ncbi:uncharacterized protein [Zea mays]|uniref:uncharacterized protein n=1 Tax=Zea mays TaxID=4577 RepID=UPI0004DE8A6B|nr:uncharacterized protein LOC103634365 [Zea mays]|eukprot:XP_008654127.1 uncharacterized protein LOC103634365 [Zea mays]
MLAYGLTFDNLAWYYIGMEPTGVVALLLRRGGDVLSAARHGAETELPTGASPARSCACRVHQAVTRRLSSAGSRAAASSPPASLRSPPPVRLYRRWPPPRLKCGPCCWPLLQLVQKGPATDVAGRPVSTATNASNPWWLTFEKAIASAGGELSKPEILSSTTDSRFARQLGIPALGFSPMTSTPILLHDHNEFLEDRVFLRGIQVYEHVIRALSSFQG